MTPGKKYTVNVAYTTPSGRMHIGHGLGHTISDVALRYGALKEKVGTFFGFGMHSTGKDLIKIISKLVEGDNLAETLRQYNISAEGRDQLLSLSTLKERVDWLVEEYRGQYQEVIEKLGVAMDYNSFFSTHQEANQRYTQWTLKKLAEKGLVIETESNRPYCAVCDDIKHIDRDLSEVTAVGKVDWDKLRIEEGEIIGGEFKCRLHSGEKIVVRRRKERAINYNNPEMQQKTIELLGEMKIFPQGLRADLENIIRSRVAKPLERKAHENIGAISPFDSSKSVEALADSNIYMEFYALSQLINQGRLRLDNLTDPFFDYVYLGQGDSETVARDSKVTIKTLEEAREYIDNIYPVDVSIVGFEHFGVHIPFSLFTHAAVLPKRYFFREYIITSHVTKDGEKMSKSKGNVLYLDELLDLTRREGKLEGLSEDASLDAVRFFLSYYQSLDRDFDWKDENFKSSGINGMKRYVTNITEGVKQLKNLENEILGLTDKWFSTVDQRTVQDITQSMDRKDSRGALIALVDVRGKVLSTYLSSPSPDSRILSGFLINQINMGYPFMPRVTEELRERYFPDSRLEWPSVNPESIFPEDYETFEHQIKGKDYERSLMRETNALLGKMLGKKEVRTGEVVTIVAPTDYQVQILRWQNIPLSKALTLEFSVDPQVKGIKIQRKE